MRERPMRGKVYRKVPGEGAELPRRGESRRLLPRRHRKVQQQHAEIRRQNPVSPPPVELTQPRPSALEIRLQQLRPDQKPTQHKEEIDPDPTHARNRTQALRQQALKMED